MNCHNILYALINKLILISVSKAFGCYGIDSPYLLLYNIIGHYHIKIAVKQAHSPLINDLIHNIKRTYLTYLSYYRQIQFQENFKLPLLVLYSAAVVQSGLGRWPSKPVIPGSNPGGRTLVLLDKLTRVYFLFYLLQLINKSNKRKSQT